MEHNGTVKLNTKRLVLRRFEVADAAAMYKNWANDPEVTRFLTWEPHVSAAATRELLEGWVANYASLDNYNWAIELNGEPIGGISVVGMSERNETAEIGYCIGRSHWGKGYVTEALSEVIGYLFGTVGFHRIEAFHDAQNPASGKVMCKCGLVQEGVKRSAWKHRNGEWHDLVLYGLVKEEWVRGWLGRK